ncbi:SDR family NAD(P)-dependent oxidoreductase [Haloarchaeobius sp. TZWSO28]|uniref:SDR family NAD(P)-dependent oxidoreductase n=1 Tax=Haloarchaeobius sp. TZWSO28 TaxID=3446119 RepID=UPI003EB817FF
MTSKTAGTHCPDRLADRVAIVTGSTKGIGVAIAERFAAEGAQVVVSGRTVQAGERVAERIRADGGNATFVRTDMADPDDVATLVEATVEEFGRVDVLVNNAAVQSDETTLEATLEEWQFVVDVDFRGYWLAAKHAAEHMSAGGSILNVSSNHAQVTMPAHFPYNAVKAGVDGLTRALAVELGPLGIRVNTLTPGWVEVDRTASVLDSERREMVESIHPLGRIGDPTDVAGAAAFLASEDASFVSGARLVVDGGRSAVMQDDTMRAYRQRLDSGEAHGRLAETDETNDGGAG